MSASRIKRPSSCCPTTTLFMCGPEISVEPVAHHVPDPRRIFVEQKVVDAAEQMQFRRLARALEHFDGLLGRRHRIVGGVDKQERARSDPADHLLGAKIEHALGGLGRKHSTELLASISTFCLSRRSRTRPGIGTISSRGTMSDLPVAARWARPRSSISVNFAQASGVGCWPRNLRSPWPQPPLEMTAAMRGWCRRHRPRRRRRSSSR